MDRIVRPASGCAQYLSDVALQNDRIWVLDGDLADSDGAEAFADRVPDRFIQAGIAEQNMVTMAAGIAACGFRPFVFSFSAFLCFRAADQIRVALAQAGLPVTLVGSHSGGLGGPNGKTHQSLNDVALISSFPGIDIWAPADDAETKFVVDAVLRGNRPAYLRYSREPFRAIGGTAAACRRFGPSTSRVLATSGYFLHLALDAQRYLASIGEDLLVLHFLKVAPAPLEELRGHLNGQSAVWVLDDHSVVGGLAAILRSAGLVVNEPVFGWPANWAGGAGTAEELIQRHKLSPLSIAKRIMSHQEM